MVAEIINLENIDRLYKAKSLLDFEKYSTPEYIRFALDTTAIINPKLTYTLDELKSIADILIEWSK